MGWELEWEWLGAVFIDHDFRIGMNEVKISTESNCGQLLLEIRLQGM